ncbi:hypothetical protein LTR62_005578 [Meristemomyces frigidus]|uniref:Stress-associated endoplasmic reticulum protein n=1 Tax=Meristemomyces frigidus TaxID=1508187 RepID=A0AAN7YF97_9PEZI|nr:hypothetical protein LTR62_005578 [Meristemomyces frigidus]
MAQTPQQRRANAAFAKSEESKRGKPLSARKEKGEKVEKAPIDRIWVYLLLFVICGGILFELLRVIFGSTGLFG